MSLLSFLLLLLSAAFHAIWNLLLKRSQEKQIASWWMVMLGGILSFPLLIWQGGPPWGVTGLLLLSILLECFYFLLLSYAYTLSDFSLVYPLARGAAPLLLTLWAWLGLGERPTLWGWAGLILLLSGLLLLSDVRHFAWGDQRRGILAALGVALLISLYTLVDGMAVRKVSPLPYALSIFAFLPLSLAPFAWKWYGWEKLYQEWKAQPWQLLLSALLGTSSYFLALLAYRLAPLAYAGAVREVSVVFAAWLGWKNLGEAQGKQRILAATLIFLGIFLIGAWG
jgi:drug/metabolite transporter (DMT)-like permease